MSIMLVPCLCPAAYRRGRQHGACWSHAWLWASAHWGNHQPGYLLAVWAARGLPAGLPRCVAWGGGHGVCFGDGEWCLDGTSSVGGGGGGDHQPGQLLAVWDGTQQPCCCCCCRCCYYAGKLGALGLWTGLACTASVQALLMSLTVFK
jgi:hypothetical protein